MSTANVTDQKTAKRRGLPLITEEKIEIDPDTGAHVHVTRHRRGILSIETRHYDASNLAAMKSVSPRQNFEEFCEHLRNRLEKSCLPSDRTPHWIKFPGGEWAPRSSAIETSEVFAKRGACALWTSRVKDLTETLSSERLTGDLLWCFTQLLRREGIEDHLWHIGQLLNAYANYRIEGPINDHVHHGVIARKSRAAGPKARRNQAIDIRRIVGTQAEYYWSQHPALRNDASNTAAAIAAVVNGELKAKGLLPAGRDALSTKTIGDYIRANIRG